MNVGTVAAIKGAVSTEDLEQIKCQVELSNTYHLHVRTGDKLTAKLADSIIHVMEPSNPHRFRRISGILPCWTAQDQRGGRLFPFPH